MKYRIACINGPNLNLQGHRKKDLYGTKTLKNINTQLTKKALKHDCEMVFYQSNHEGEIIDFLQKEKNKFDGIIINPGPLTSYGYAFRDALVDTGSPFVSVHLSNIYSRNEKFRHKDIFSNVAIGGIYGFRENSYFLALEALLYLFGHKSLKN